MGGMTASSDHAFEAQVSEIRIEILSALIAFVMSFLVMFGWWRRWCTHWFIQKGVMVAYILSFTLVTYTIGLMQSATAKVEVYPVWAVCFLTVFGCTNSIKAYSLEDNYRIWRQVVQYVLYTIYVLLILFSAADGVNFIAVFLMLIITLVKVYIRIASSKTATDSSLYSKIAADYMDMENEKTSRPEDYNPVNMKGYCYLISGKFKSQDWSRAPIIKYKAPNYALEGVVENFDVITIEDIWQECYKCGTLLGSDSYKDISLSFSLFHLLVLRFFGFTCGESTKQKTQDFVIKGLLEYGSDHDRERAFKVIEFELSFLYDFFFTKYSTLNSRGMTIWALASVASILFVMALTVMRASGGRKPWMSLTHAIVTEPTDAHMTITVLILAALALVEVLQLVIYWTSNWGRVAFVCQYVRQTPSSKANPSCWMRLKAFLTSVNLFSTRKYCWKHQLGQYNLLHSVGHHTCFGSLTNISNICCKIVSILGLPRNFYPEVPVSLKAWHVLVPSEVRQSVVTSLKQGGGQLTNGAASLECNGANHLLWACSQHIQTSAKEKGTQTRTILTWHIATCYCEMARGSSPPHHAAELKGHMLVATTLSQYCAYLIVNAPQLLPGHMCDTSCLFRAAAREAASVLKDKEDKYEAMRNLAELAEETIFSSGVKLGKQLEEIQDITRRWTVIADFWSEMMLYVAPSDNIKAHIEQLANGGEFITQLWALLFHAGIRGHHQGAAYD